jgi:hypothetical protein
MIPAADTAPAENLPFENRAQDFMRQTALKDNYRYNMLCFPAFRKMSIPS